jgi:hypothetical protein
VVLQVQLTQVVEEVEVQTEDQLLDQDLLADLESL